jgi:FMN phosphatase YigB (HAD superfamily)
MNSINNRKLIKNKEETALRILYIIEPDVEMDDPLFRYGSLKSIILPEARSIMSIVNLTTGRAAVEVAIILSEAVYLKSQKDGLCFDDVIPIIVNYDLNIKKENYIFALAEKKFNPQLVISYENYRVNIDKLFPNATILHMMFGPFSRFPFPTCHTYDVGGIYSNADFLNNYHSSIPLLISSKGNNFLKDFRRKTLKIISKYTPYKRLAHDLRAKYDNIVIFAAQVDGHPAFTNCSMYEDHYSALFDILKKLPAKHCILVTQHPYRRSFTNNQIDELCLTFDNVTFLDETMIVEDCSQYLMPYCSGIITTSSNLAYQAVLYNLPVFLLGNSHLNIFSVSEDISVFSDQVSTNLDKKSISHNEAVIVDLISRNVRLHRHNLTNPASYVYFLLKLAGINTENYSWLQTAMEDDCPHDENYIVDSVNERAVREAASHWKLPEIYGNGDLLLSAVADHEVLSFDLFDTLVQRSLSKPHLLFRLIEPEAKKIAGQPKLDFWLIRREAEADVRRPTRGDYEITLEQIYDRFQEISGVSDNVKGSLIKLECEAELRICRRKESVLFYKELASRLGKKTGIISDFYIETDFINLLLNYNNIDYDFLYVSASEGTRKQSGTIYPLLIEWAAQNGYEKDMIVHIGDNKIADLEMAKANGLDAFFLPQAIENFGASKIGSEAYRRAHTSDSISDAIVTGLIATKFYSGPFHHILSDRHIPTDHYALGYACYGPLLLGFVNWLYKECTIKGTKKLHFLSRDGFILKQAFELLYGEVIDTSYLFASRKAYGVAASYCCGDLESLASFSFNSQKFSSFVKNRFGYDLHEGMNRIVYPKGLSSKTVVSYPHHLGKIFDWISLNEEILLDHCKKERTALLLYLETEEIFIDQKNAPSIVDLGYSGTMQVKLDALLGCKTKGYYFLSHMGASNQLEAKNVSAYLAQFDDHFSRFRDQFNDHVFLFEAAFSAPHPTVISFMTKAGNKILMGDPGVEERNGQPLRKMHRGMIDYIADAKKSFGSDLLNIQFSPSLARASLISLSSNPTNQDASLFFGNGVENNFGGGSVYLIYPLKENIINKNQYDFAVDRSKWKRGAVAFYSMRFNSNPKRESLAVSNRYSSTLNDPTYKGLSSFNKIEKFRKIGKLKRNPYLFFADSKNVLLQKIRFLFSARRFGRINTYLLQTLLSGIGR